MPALYKRSNIYVKKRGITVSVTIIIWLVRFRFYYCDIAGPASDLAFVLTKIGLVSLFNFQVGINYTD